MASLAELQDALVNADKAGDVDAARKLADAIVSMQSVQAAKPAAVKAGEAIGGIPRQLGLAARYGIEGLANLAQIGTEPIRNALAGLSESVPAERRPTGWTPPDIRPLGQAASNFADTIGLPKPEGANERVIGEASRLVAGAGGMAGAAGSAAKLLTGPAQTVARTFATAPAQQAIAAGAAGLSGGSVREAGGGPGAQFTAALAGGIAAPFAVNAIGGMAQRGVNAIRTALTPQRVIDQQVDQQISLALRQAGIDWAGVSERVKQTMRADAQAAITNGQQLNPEAAARMLQFRLVPGTQPTQGMISQNPIQITREKNLAKVGANSLDVGLQRLPNLESSNTRALLQNLDDAGAAGAPDAFATGERVLGALRSNADASRGRIDALYSAARDTSGRSAALDPAAFSRRVSSLLDDANVGSFLPADIRNKVNAIASAQPGYKFNVNSAEQLKTSVAALQRGSTDGNVRRALGLVRQALDDTPLMSAPSVNPGNLPAVAGTVPPSPAVLGAESIAAFNRARQANRAFMNRVENTPALAAALDDAQPDRFVQQYIIGQGATARDLTAMQRAIGNDPQAMQAVRGNILGHLRTAATGQAGDINKFRADSFNNALNAMGDRKLAVFFSPEEITRLRAIGRVSNYMSAQPAGTAVNNSNSGALVAAKALEAIDAIAGRLPLGLDTMIQGTVRGIQQRQVMNSGNALQQLAPQAARGNPMLALPVIAAGQRPEDR
jgi:hypothetical protein